MAHQVKITTEYQRLILASDGDGQHYNAALQSDGTWSVMSRLHGDDDWVVGSALNYEDALCRCLFHLGLAGGDSYINSAEEG